MALASREDAFYPRLFREEFERISRNHIPITAHAGENAPAGFVESAILDLRAKRLVCQNQPLSRGDKRVYALRRRKPKSGFRLGLCAPLGGIMLGGLLFVVCVILQFHYHDPIPWYIWVLALIAQFVSFGEPAMRSAVKSKKD